MGITILLMFLSMAGVGLFQIVFTKIDTWPYKIAYYELIFKLNENLGDTELKNKAIEAGNAYYSRLKYYRVGSVNGQPSSASMIRIRDAMDEEFLYKDMARIVSTKKRPKY